MKTIKFIAILSFAIALNLKAQLNTFSKQIIYSVEAEMATPYNGLQQTTDKGYITCRAVLDTVGGTSSGYSEFIKIGKTGNISWTKRLAIGTYLDTMMSLGIDFIQTQDKGYAIATSIYKTNKLAEIILAKTDSNTNLIWSAKYPGEGGSTPYCIKQTLDNGYIICGYTKDVVKQYAYIFKIDSAGNYTWGKKCIIDTGNAGAFYSVLELPGQGYIAVGYSENSAIAVKFDLAGNQLWDKDLFNLRGQNYMLSTGFYSVIKTSDNDILISGSYNDTTDVLGISRLCFAKFDQAGNLIWLKGYNQTPTPYYGSYAWSLKEIPNYFVFGGYISDPMPATLIGKLDLNGNIIWCNEYRSTFHTFNYIPNKIIRTADNGFALSTLVGTVRGGMSNFSKELLKTDSTGSLDCDGIDYPITLGDLNYTPTSHIILSPSGTAINYSIVLSHILIIDTTICENINDPDTLGVKDFKITSFDLSQNFPNPFSMETNINYTLNQETQSVSLEITDLLGKTLLEQKQDNSVGTHSVSLTNLNLSKGVYFYSLLVDGRKITRKMLVQ